MNLYQVANELQRNPVDLVAFGCKAAENVSAGAWLALVGQWRAVIDAQPSSKKVAVFLSDSAEFSAIVFALWSLDREVWLAPNNLPKTVAQLDQCVDGFIGEFPEFPTLSRSLESKPLPAGWSLPRNAQLVLFTSGSSGAPKQVRKSAHQLAAEIDQLQLQFGADLGRVSVFSTVSHQHIYGFLFRVLWPLTVNRPFSRHTLEFLEELPRGKSAMLISSPSHLSRLPAALNTFEGQLQAVFSSGAPLSLGASKLAQQRLGCEIVEVLGSTETGGIGWRIQANNGPFWRPFSVVEVAPDAAGIMSIRSPFLPDDQSYVSADIIRMQGEQFELLGRADRIVKVEGKRVALEQIEAELLAHPWVEDVRVQPVARLSTVAERDELVVLLVLSSTGSEFMAQQGRREVIDVLSKMLAAVLERPLRPRRWRFLTQLPRNNQGKMALEDLEALIVSAKCAE